MGVISLLLPNSIFGMIASAGAMNLLELRCLMLKSSLVLLSTNIHYNLPFVKNICLVWYKFDHIIGQYNFAI